MDAGAVGTNGMGSDLKEWIEEWKREGKLEITGMQPRQRVPHRAEENYLVWK